MERKENKSSYFQDVLKRFLAHRLAMFGAIILTIEILSVIFLPVIMKLDLYTMDYMNFGGAPSAQHILGCDDVGRDLFARLIFGGRVSLMVGICSALVSLIIGVPLGLIAGYFRGWAETIIMRCADVFMSFPSMILILVLASVLGKSVMTVTSPSFLIFISSRPIKAGPSGVDGICKADLCQRPLHKGEGLCGIGKGHRDKERPDSP